MSFLSSVFLLASAMGVIPFLVHLLARQKAREVNWAAFQFLMGQDATKNARSIRITDLLLLVARTLAVLALIFAFAQPVLNRGWFSPPVELVLMLDISMSMDAKVDTDEFGESRSALQLAKEIACEEIASLRSVDQLRILLVEGRPRWLTDLPIAVTEENRKVVLNQIAAVETKTCKSSFGDALRTVLRTPMDPRFGERQIVFITDGTATAFNDRTKTELKVLKQQLENVKIPSRVAIRTAISKSVDNSLARNSRPTGKDNVFVQSIQLERELIALGESARVSIEVRNANEEAVSGMTVELTCGERSLGSTILAYFEPQSTRRVEFVVSLSETGYAELTARIKGLEDNHQCNKLLLDDEASCLVHVVESLPVLIVDGSLLENPSGLLESGFLITALGGESNGIQKPDDAKRKPPLSVFRPIVKSPIEAANVEELKEYAAIVWLNAKLPSDEKWNLEVKSFLKSGGGFWLVLGDRNASTPDERNKTTRFLAQAGWHSLAVGAIRNDSDADTMPNKPTNVLLCNERHPVTRLFRQSDIQSNLLMVTKQVQLEGIGLLASETLLANSDGKPLLLSQNRKHGRFLLQTFGLNRESSNLPIVPLYLPLVQEALHDLVVQQFPKVNIGYGESVQLPRLLNGISLDHFSIKPPREVAIECTSSERFLHAYQRTYLAGLHQVSVGEKPACKFCVARDLEESLLTPISDETRMGLVAAGIGWQQLTPQVTPTYTTRRLAELLLILVLLFMMVEALLAASRMVGRRRLINGPRYNILGEVELNSIDSLRSQSTELVSVGTRTANENLLEVPS